MRRALLALAAFGALLPGLAAAQTLDARNDSIQRRIDEGSRNGGLTREEADRLRDEFYSIRRLENDYQRNGLSSSERNELNRRLDALSNRIDRERHDPDQRGDAIYTRLDQLRRNIQEGERGGGLTRREADQLSAELDSFDRDLAAARRSGDGLDGRERDTLNRRLEQVANRILAQRRDGDKQPSYNNRNR